MFWIMTKYALTAGMVVLISEVAKRSDKVGALIAALPTVTILALIWMYIEGQGQEKLANHAYYTFWYVLPTLPMFLIFPILIRSILVLAVFRHLCRCLYPLFFCRRGYSQRVWYRAYLTK